MSTLEGVKTTSSGAGVAVVSFIDEHDLATSAELADVLAAVVHHNDVVVADFSGALFVDSSTLKVLVATHKLAAQRGARFRIQLGDGCPVMRTFEISGLLDALSWASSREEALDGSGPRGSASSSDGSSGAPA